MRIGNVVLARERITEENFNGHAVWTHAQAGNTGVIQAIDDGWYTVTWDRTKTTTDCDASELIEVLEAWA